MAARSTFTKSAGNAITAAQNNSIRDHLVTYTGSNDVATEGQMCANTSTDRLVIYSGSAVVELASYGAWTTFTARMTQNGGGTYNALTAAECEWTRSGRSVEGGGMLTLAGAIGASAGNPIQIAVTGLPAVSGTIGTHLIGNFIYQDTGTTSYEGSLFMTSAGIVTMQANSQAAYVGQAPSFAMAVGDIVWVNFRYRASSAS